MSVPEDRLRVTSFHTGYIGGDLTPLFTKAKDRGSHSITHKIETSEKTSFRSSYP